jgi:ribosomal protein S18 acetylase RimI-like enzyme
MQISRLTRADVTRLRPLRLRALRDSPSAFSTTYEAALAWPDEAWARQLAELVTFVAVEAERDVGMVRCAPHEDLPAAAALLSMWVAPEARGRGAGSALVDAVVGWAREGGFHRVVLDVVDDNAAAISLYARHGFEPTGVTAALPPPRAHVREHQRARAL